jgi:transglutaminase-like putative cysteine protease
VEADKPFRIIGQATLGASWVGGERLAKVPPGPCPEELRAYLGPFRNGPELNPAQPDCLTLARTLRGKTSAETVQNILVWLEKNIVRGPPYGPDTLSEILKNRHGLCHHQSILMTSLCRAAGVPAVIAHGISLPDGNGEAKIGHGWLQVYLNGIGWVPVEPMNTASLRCFSGTTYLFMHTTGHTREQNHFDRRYRSLQNYTAQVERLE